MSSSPTTQTSQSGESQNTWAPHESMAPTYGWMAGNQDYFNQNPVPYFPGQTYVGPSDPTMQGIDMAMQAANGMNPYLDAQLQNYQFLSTAADIENNPAVQAQMAANANAVNTQLNEQWLPQVNNSAGQVNAMGSSRQGLAEGNAIAGASDALAQANANTMMNAYTAGLGAQQAALAGTGGAMNNMLMPANTMMQAGQGIEGYQQLALQDAMNRYAYQYQEPWNRMGNAGQTMNQMFPMGTGYGANTGMAQSPNPGYQDPFQMAMGLGSLGVGAYSAGLFSDRRLKRNIKRIGTTNAGYPWYEFDYVWGEHGQGVMADEVPADWVIDHPSGFKMVDYGRVK